MNHRLTELGFAIDTFDQIDLVDDIDQYSVKLIFVSKENHVVSVAEKPDKYHA